MTGTELVLAPSRMPSRQEIHDLGVLANGLAASGFFKDARGGAQALAKLVFGRDLGLSATAAMTGVHIIEGKPEISANVQAQMVKTYAGPEGERYDYKILPPHDDQRCEIEFLRRWQPGGDWESLGTIEYTIEMARTAGLAGKAVWQKHTRNMLFARAMSDGVAFYCPEVTNGIRVYHEHEIDVDGAQRVNAEQAPAAPNVQVEVIDGDVADETGTVAGNGHGPVTPVVTAPPPQRTEPLITSKQSGLLHARCAEIGLNDDTRHALIHCITGQPHSDRVPKRLLGHDGTRDGEPRDGLLGVLAAGKDAQITPAQLLDELRRAYGAHGGPLQENTGALIQSIPDAAIPFAE